ncbi:MAG TPA: VIT1/CCC1 transporter family protein, partial [Patescibacteria group bacterium]|nr:VIT1/CCC1 transporter family protein [Patescibacteria group bacterium]
EALAGAFSMATGAFLASQAERQVHLHEIAKEKEEIRKYPKEEKEELALLLREDGLSEESAKEVVKILGRSQKAFLNTMIQKELGLEPNPPGTPTKDAVFMGFSYLLSAIIPLFPYFFFTGIQAIIFSIGATLIALFLIGVAKGKVASLPYFKSGVQVLLVGAGSGIGGYFIGILLPHLLGIK